MAQSIPLQGDPKTTQTTTKYILILFTLKIQNDTLIDKAAIYTAHQIYKGLC